MRIMDQRKIVTWFRVFLAEFMILLFFAVTVTHLRQYLNEQKSYLGLRGIPQESYAFRNLVFDGARLEELKLRCEEMNEDWLKVFAAVMLDADFSMDGRIPLEDMELWIQRAEGYEKRDPEKFLSLVESYEAIFGDLACFPVAASALNEKAAVSFENSWMFERSFGGVRGHEGTDIMPEIREANFYPVLSMTDGTVEKVGWLTQGGYRIGIRSPGGGYFYYAHLSAYARDFQEGETVKAGEMLGYMGNTGYGEEGTTGMFDVHLHLGIYIRTENYRELSVNPYWVLKYLEDSRIQYNF